MSGGKGGSTSASVEVPEFIRAPAERNIQRAEQVQQLGYMPYMGVDVAAPTPGMQNLMQQRGRTAEMLVIVGPGYDALAGLPQQRNIPQNVTQFDTPTTSEAQLNQIYMEELGRPLGEEGRNYWLQQSGIQDPNQIRAAVRQSEEAAQFQTGPQTIGGVTGYRSYDPAFESVQMLAEAAPEQMGRFGALYQGTPTQQVNEMTPDEAASLLGQIAMQAQGGNSDGGNGSGGFSGPLSAEQSYMANNPGGFAFGLGEAYQNLQGNPLGMIASPGTAIAGALTDRSLAGQGYGYVSDPNARGGGYYTRNRDSGGNGDDRDEGATDSMRGERGFDGWGE